MINFGLRFKNLTAVCLGNAHETNRKVLCRHKMLNVIHNEVFESLLHIYRLTLNPCVSRIRYNIVFRTANTVNETARKLHFVTYCSLFSLHQYQP